ncbi:MAG: hypothetical protein Q4P71_02090 [Actinomycetaceae bacterium]|nr:hypothetical protein [Actinomycetaceae bacterium]
MTDNNPENRIIDDVNSDVDTTVAPSADSGHESGDVTSEFLETTETPDSAESAESVNLAPSWHRLDEITSIESAETPASSSSATSAEEHSDEASTASNTELPDSAVQIEDVHADDAGQAGVEDVAGSDDERNESAVSSDEPADDGDADEDSAETPASDALTYTSAIQRITSAMASGQLAQKLRARLVKHSHDVAHEREDLLPPPPPLPDDELEVSDGNDSACAPSAESAASADEPDAPVVSAGDEWADDSDQTIDTGSSEPVEPEAENDEATELTPVPSGIPHAVTPDEDEETSTATAADDTAVVLPPVPAPPASSASTTDLPPLKPAASVEPKRMTITRSGNKILALPAGTQVLKNSLRSVRTTIDTLNSGGRIDPTRPTIAIFAVGIAIAGILSIATLKGTFDFGYDSARPVETPTPTVSSPEPIPEESEAPEQETETQTPKPVIQDITVISYNDDDGDHQELADRMIDNDTSTNWQSRYFATADLPEGNTVRLIITLQESVPVSEVIFTGAISGGQVDLRINDGSDPFGGAALTSSEMGQTTTLKPTEATTGNTVTLNFVSLPTDDEGVNRVKITELQVR